MTLLSADAKNPKKTDKGEKSAGTKRLLSDSVPRSECQKRSKILVKPSESRLIEQDKPDWNISRPGHDTYNHRLKSVGNQKTSEGVQDLIKHVSVFIENKYPLKNRQPDETRYAAQEQTTVRGVAIKTQPPPPKIRQIKTDLPTSRKDSPTFRYSVRKGNSQEKTLATTSKGPSTKNACPRKCFASTNLEIKDKNPKTKDEKTQQEIDPRRKMIQTRIQKFQELVEEAQNSPIASQTLKRSKPSEIPRKIIPRPELMNRTESFSLLLQNQISEADSSLSVDASKMIGLTIEATLDEETSADEDDGKLKVIQSVANDSYHAPASQPDDRYGGGRKQTPIKCIDDVDACLELKESLKVPNIPMAYPLESSDSSTIVTKAKKLDLDRMKSSKMTVLTSSETFQKLENFHRQNSSSSTKLKHLTLKTSYSSLTSKTSKKNLNTNALGREDSKASLKSNRSQQSKEGLRTPRPGDSARGQSDEEKLKRSSKPSSRQSDRSLRLPSGYGEKPPTGREKPIKSLTVLESRENETKVRVESHETILDNEQTEQPTTDLVISKYRAELTTPFSDSSQQSLMSHASENIAIEPETVQSVIMPVSKEKSPSSTSKILPFSNSCEKPYKSTSMKPGAQNKDKISGSKTNRNSKPETRTKVKKPVNDLVVRGTRIQLMGKQEIEPVDVDLEKPKLEIKIDFEPPEEAAVPQPIIPPVENEELKIEDSRYNDVNGESTEDKSDLTLDEEIDEEWRHIDTTPTGTPHIDSSPDAIRIKAYKSSTSIKRKLKYKTSLTRLKTRPKKKKMSKPEPVNHSLLGPAGHFSSVISFNSKSKKTKPDSKVRSGLTRALNQEGLIDGDLNYPFEDAVAVNLRRRNSEPNSFRGFIWKQPDIAVSSMASSLRHMNADELEDFRVWEAAPLKMASCWEMSLYHCRRPWSVLSCSVFKDNRMANAPGIILENLRNGGTLDLSGSLFCEKDRIGVSAVDAFDIEPSIAQKDIDIRNWLSALNFPTPPSTSNDAILEGNFMSAIPIGSPKNQLTPKRRKILRTVNYSDETLRKKFEDNRSLNPEKANDLMDLIRRKSGGFVTVDNCSLYGGSNQVQYLATVSQESQTNVQGNQGEILTPDLGALKTKSDGPQMLAGPQGVQDEGLDDKFQCCLEEVSHVVPIKQECKSRSRTIMSTALRFLKGETNINLWKYLFILSLGLILYNVLDGKILVPLASS